MTRKSKVTLSAQQKLEYAKLMVEEGYTNKQIEEMSGAGKSAVSRWKQQYLSELDGKSLNLKGQACFKFCLTSKIVFGITNPPAFMHYQIHHSMIIKNFTFLDRILSCRARLG